MKDTPWDHGLRVSAEDGGLVGHAGAVLLRKLGAPRGALSYRPRSGHGLEEVSVGLMAYLDP